jgi:hypothetical protein
MKRFFVLLIAFLVAMAFSACSVPRQPDPDLEKVHQDHKEAQEDLADEEDKKKEEEE